MRVDELHYELPAELIAQHPTDRREASRLLVLDRGSGQVQHEQFSHLPELLPAGALLVLNDTRVLPARLIMHRRTGGRVEGLFLREAGSGLWELMVTGAGRLKSGEELLIDDSPRRLRLRERMDAGVWLVEPVPAGETLTILGECGRPPLPPYIKRGGREEGERERQRDGERGSAQENLASDLERYQTVYARVPGAVAAPTAGLHFTAGMFEALGRAGIATTFVTLHVGVGTFAPIRALNLADHPMHAEWFECPPAAAEAVNTARRQGRPIVAVGTTSVRVLETSADEAGRIHPGSGQTRIFIYPPYRFRAVDVLLTNFHLPESTLLALVFAFGGRDLVLLAYREAIRERYRFYSYGDAMMVR